MDVYPEGGVATRLQSNSSGKDARRNEPWLLTYSDTITLLFTFVLIILKISSIDVNKAEELREGLSQTFLKKDISTAFQSFSKEIEQVTNINHDLQVDITSRYVTIELTNSSIYDVGSADIVNKEIKTIQSVVDILIQDPYARYTLEVEGHTDDVPIKNLEFQSNWELSTARATNIVRYLEENGVSRERMKAIGYADSKPLPETLDINGNIVPEKRPLNRRISIRISRYKIND